MAAAIGGIVPAAGTGEAATLTARELMALRGSAPGALVMAWALLAALASVDAGLAPAAAGLKAMLDAQGIPVTGLQLQVKALLNGLYQQASALITANPYLAAADVRALVAQTDLPAYDALVAALPQLQALAAGL